MEGLRTPVGTNSRGPERCGWTSDLGSFGPGVSALCPSLHKSRGQEIEASRRTARLWARGAGAARIGLGVAGSGAAGAAGRTGLGLGLCRTEFSSAQCFSAFVFFFSLPPPCTPSLSNLCATVRFFFPFSQVGRLSRIENNFSSAEHF